MDKTKANAILTKLDSSAGRIESLAKAGKIDLRLATSLINQIDRFADKLEIAAYGEKNLRVRQAKVIRRDSDEKYMETFENPIKPLKTDSDEEYMHKVGPSLQSKGIETYDQDPSSNVTDRPEYEIRDLNEWSDGTKKQPSWTKGPAGKSTKQGAAKSVEKNWA